MSSRTVVGVVVFTSMTCLLCTPKECSLVQPRLRHISQLSSCFPLESSLYIPTENLVVGIWTFTMETCRCPHTCFSLIIITYSRGNQDESVREVKGNFLYTASEDICLSGGVTCSLWVLSVSICIEGWHYRSAQRTASMPYIQ